MDKKEGQFLSRNFKLEEFTRSSTAEVHGICNEPSVDAISNLQNLCQEVLQPLRDYYGKRIYISSGFRCRALNEKVGGVPNSQHVTGEAADLVLPSVSMGYHWFNWIKAHCRNYDQLILERNKAGKYWIHVSSRRQLWMNRHQAFFATRS